MLLEWEKLYRNKVMVLQAKTGIDTKARIDQITEGVENLPVRLSIPVVHKEEVQVPDVVNQKLDKTTRQHMSGLFVGPIADVGHQCGSLELATNPRINTLRPSPVCLNTDFAVMLHALELLDPLLNDIALDQRRDHRC
jgi:hypothetical protein